MSHLRVLRQHSQAVVCGVCVQSLYCKRTQQKRGLICRELIGRDEGRIADDLASLMDQNFAVRRRVYGDEALGERNLEMLQTAKGVGASAKFCGSGGCVLALCPGGEDQSVKLLGTLLMLARCCRFSCRA